MNQDLHMIFSVTILTRKFHKNIIQKFCVKFDVFSNVSFFFRRDSVLTTKLQTTQIKDKITMQGYSSNI